MTRTIHNSFGLLLFGAALTLTNVAYAQTSPGCGLHYVAAGDDIPNGHDASTSERYPDKLVASHLKTWGAWCEYDIAKNGTTSSQYISNGQLATTWNDRPDLITLQIGEQDSTVVNLITDCFDKVKSHDFPGANTCAAAVLGNSSNWSNLNSNLITIQQQYRMILAGRPKLVVAVMGYPNPYPHTDTATAKIAELCVPLIDTIPTCTVRWAMLPPALELLDQSIKKLNSTISTAVSTFANATQGRFVFVNTYDKLRDHCMQMKVTIKTTVEHPEEEGAVHEHDSPEVNFGCDTSWFKAGSDGTDTPTYLDPAVIGVLTNKSQTTSGMGVYPNGDGHKCIQDLIWEADTIDPGVSPLKWKLGVPEAPKSSICQ
jgi:hypothetical protein